MGIATKSALLGASDLREEELVLPSLKLTVKVRGQSAAASSKAQGDALEVTTLPSGDQVARVNTSTMLEIQLEDALVEPKLTRDEIKKFMAKNGPAVKLIEEKIDELSGVDKEALAEARAKFPGGGETEERGDSSDGSPARSSRPTVST